MLEDVIKELSAAIKEQTAAMLDVKRMFEAMQVVIPLPGNDKAEEPAPDPRKMQKAPAAVAEPAVLNVPAGTPAPAPEPAVLTVPAGTPAPAPEPVPVIVPAPSTAPAVAPAPVPAAAPAETADPVPTNYKEAKTLGLRMAAEGHSDILKEFLESCGVRKLIDLPHDRYGDYYKWFKDRGLL